MIRAYEAQIFATRSARADLYYGIRRAWVVAYPSVINLCLDTVGVYCVLVCGYSCQRLLELSVCCGACVLIVSV